MIYTNDILGELRSRVKKTCNHCLSVEEFCEHHKSYMEGARQAVILVDRRQRISHV